jgi:hypothetical protein
MQAKKKIFFTNSASKTNAEQIDRNNPWQG